MKIFRTVIAIMLLTASLTTNAQELVTTLRSIENETYGSFVKRTALFMDNWTSARNTEICGLFARNGNAFSIRLYTLNAQTACRGTTIADGYAFVGQHIHSHPVGEMRITNATRLQDKSLEDRRIVRMTLPDDKFSGHDLALPGGYLTTNGKLLWQNGPNDVEHLGPIADLKFPR